MLAVWLENQAISLRENLPIPVPGEGEALVKIHLAGICSTDLELKRGYYLFTGIPGHEFVGVVDKAPGSPEWIGTRVVGEINLVCGDCPACRSGHSHHCENRTVLGIIDKDGAFAEYLTLPLKNLHLIPDSIPDEAAVFIEPLAAALEILEQVHIQPNDRVLVVGAGRLGQLIAQVINLTGCKLEVLTRRESQDKLLSKSCIPSISMSELRTGMWDIVVEATGSRDGFKIARQAVRSKGMIVLKSTYKGDLQLDISSIVVDEITMVGSRCGPFPPAIELLEKQLVDPLPLISAQYPLSEAQQAFDHAAQAGIFKVLLQPAE